MLTLPQQRDRLLAALEDALPLVDRDRLDTQRLIAHQQARALIAECRAEGRASAWVDNRGAPTRLYSVCSECGSNVLRSDEHTEAGSGCRNHPQVPALQNGLCGGCLLG